MTRLLCILALLLPFAHASATDVNDVRLAKAHFSKLFYPEIEPDLRRAFAKSGLAPTDIDRQIQQAVDGFSDCVIDALAADTDPRSHWFLNVLSRGLSKERIDAEWLEFDPTTETDFFDALEQPIKECGYVVKQEAGLPARL